MARPRISAAALELHGTGGYTRAQLKARREEEFAPVITPGAPVMPDTLSVEARPVWRETVALLAARGTITPADVSILAVFCEVKARWEQAKIDLATRGLVVTDADGNDVPNPFLKIAQQSEKSLISLAQELGITPAKRYRVKIESPRKGAPRPGTGAAMFPELFMDSEQIQ